MNTSKLMTGFLGLTLAAALAQAEEPSIRCKMDGVNFIVTYTGELYQSSDAVSWSKVESASSPYQVKTEDKQLFFCAKASDEPYNPILPGENTVISLPDNVKLDMIWVNPGTFIMGAPEDEIGRVVDEIQHQVTLTKGYWLGKYEVTQAQYKAVMGANPSSFIGDDLPVERINWDKAMDFCAKLTASEKAAGRLPEGYEYTLPTEAQWEYACRAGTTTAFNSGKDIPSADQRWDNPCPNLDEVGWYQRNSDKETHPVGQKLQNAWGFYDMHGNVREHCLDWYAAYPSGNVIDPIGPSIGRYRVMRGSSFFNQAYSCRSACRDIYAGPNPLYYDGFRVALAPIPVSKDRTIPLSDDVDLDLVWVDPGTFIMGSPKDERGRQDNETQHEVTLTKGYWLGRYQVTQAQYEAIMGTNPSNFKGADLPVEMVNWDEAKEFCAKLTASEKTAGRLPEGYEYTLPTEAQWEYACRAGTTTAFNNDLNIPKESQVKDNPCPNLNKVGWYGYNSDQKTHPVGQKQPNGWGIYDMHGNVWEWCLDWYGAYPTESVTDPTGPEKGSYRVLRGGGWDSNGAYYCRSAYRGNDKPNAVYASLGFRVALAPVK